MTRQILILLAASGSFALLAAAFFLQALGWAPCAMCLWQRWPHAAAIGFGALGFVFPKRIVAFGGAASAATTSAIGAYHSGVELKWWEGPSSCTSAGQDLGALSADALLPGASDAPALIMCDTLTPFLFGLTMANWNMFASAGLTVIWLIAALRKET